MVTPFRALWFDLTWELELYPKSSRGLPKDWDQSSRRSVVLGWKRITHKAGSDPKWGGSVRRLAGAWKFSSKGVKGVVSAILVMWLIDWLIDCQDMGIERRKRIKKIQRFVCLKTEWVVYHLRIGNTREFGPNAFDTYLGKSPLEKLTNVYNSFMFPSNLLCISAVTWRKWPVFMMVNYGYTIMMCVNQIVYD